MLSSARRLAVAILALGIVLAPAGAQAATKHPATHKPTADLRAKSTRPSAAAAKPGDVVTVKVTVVNRGKGRAGATVTRLSLGAGRTFAEGVLAITTIRKRPIPAGRPCRP